METLVSYELRDAIATIAMNDGKVNVLSLQMLSQVNGALDQAESDGAVVVLTGRDGIFSAGFDLRVLTAGGTDAADMLRGGFELSRRLLSFPRPVVIACPGHAIAMGAFLLLSGDYRVGAQGAHRVTANEVAIGLTMPETAIEICRQRLAPAFFNRAVINAEIFTPDEAVTAGFFDRVAPPAELHAVARAAAVQLTTLNMEAHAATKLRTRGQALSAISRAIEADDAAVRARL
ncbi:MAG: crotonase/enoyl-CoA hydratase family protein [Acidimicrobiales bacterium]|jgi:enoyl-CoA hydratase